VSQLEIDVILNQNQMPKKFQSLEKMRLLLAKHEAEIDAIRKKIGFGKIRKSKPKRRIRKS
jgi:hypothetical protein